MSVRHCGLFFSFIGHQRIEDQRERGERFAGHEHTLTDFMSHTKRCSCNRRNRQEDVDELDEPSVDETDQPQMLRVQSVYRAAGDGGFRPRCPAEQPDCLSPWALARIARELGPMMMPGVLEELPPELQDEALQRIETRARDDLLM